MWIASRLTLLLSQWFYLFIYLYLYLSIREEQFMETTDLTTIIIIIIIIIITICKKCCSPCNWEIYHHYELSVVWVIMYFH